MLIINRLIRLPSKKVLSLSVGSFFPWLLSENIKKFTGNYFENMDFIPTDTSEKLKTSSSVIKENTTEILEPNGRKVFYNPVQEFNRDLSVLVLQEFSKELLQNSNDNADNKADKKFRIVEAFSATGLRSIRYAKEVPNVSEVIANDISKSAIECIQLNIKHNNVENIVKPNHGDAVALMFGSIQPNQRFEAVDLDPYGSPTQFLDSAVQCVADGGILMVTCTDTAILCGNFPETCYVKYGALSLRTQSIHEMAIRIVLQNIQSHASRYKRYIVPILSVSADFYIRVFVKIFTSASACKDITSKLSMVHHCTGCGAVTLQPLGVIIRGKNGNPKSVKHTVPRGPPVTAKCVHCGGAHEMGGPIWNGPIHDQCFVAKLIQSNEIESFGTSKRIFGMLSLIQEELYDVPLYYRTSQLCAILKCLPMPIMTIRSAILNAGFRVSFSHAAKESLKTDAPMSFIWDIFRKWVDESSSKPRIVPGTPGDNILKAEIQNEVDFSLRPDANPLSREKKLTRYQWNPLPFWGPGSKSTTANLMENPKKARNQNKRKLAREKKNLENSKEKEPKLEDPVVCET